MCYNFLGGGGGEGGRGAVREIFQRSLYNCTEHTRKRERREREREKERIKGEI